MIGGLRAQERFLAEDAGRVHPVMAAALAPFAPADSRAVALGPSFAAWRVLSDGKAQAIEVVATTLAEAVDQAKVQCAHKDVFVIRVTDALTAETKAHFFAVKRKSQGRWVVRDHVPTKVHDQYAEPLFALAVSAFQPVEPWRWTPGCDVGGYARHRDVVS